MYSLEQKIVIFFLLLEVGIVTLLVFLAYGMKLYEVIKGKKDKRKLAKIKAALNNKKAPPYLERPDLVFIAFNEMKQLTLSGKAKVVSEHLIKPLRRNINDDHWMKRYYLLQAYQYYIEDKDKDNLIALIEDDVPIISMDAMGLSHNLPDPDIYDVIIYKLSTLGPMSRKIYINQLRKTKVLLNTLKSTLSDETSKKTKQICYKILEHLGPDESFVDLAKEDVKQSDLELKLAAIPVLACSENTQSLKILMELLKDENWLVRNKVVQALGGNPSSSTLNLIADCLNDDNLWVRISAAKALLKQGDEGRLLLTEYSGSTEVREPSLAAYFLDIQRMKEIS